MAAFVLFRMQTLTWHIPFYINPPDLPYRADAAGGDGAIHGLRHQHDRASLATLLVMLVLLYFIQPRDVIFSFWRGF